MGRIHRPQFNRKNRLMLLFQMELGHVQSQCHWQTDRLTWAHRRSPNSPNIYSFIGLNDRLCRLQRRTEQFRQSGIRIPSMDLHEINRRNFHIQHSEIWNNPHWYPQHSLSRQQGRNPLLGQNGLLPTSRQQSGPTYLY